MLERAKSKNKWDRQHAEQLLLQLEEQGKIRDNYPCPVQVIRLGDDLTIIPMAGEAVVDFSLRLKRELGGPGGSGPAIWVPGYCNDVFAYIPSKRVLLEGGYEAGCSFFPPAAGELLVNASLEQLGDLFLR